MSKLRENRCYAKMIDKEYPVGAWIPPLPEIFTEQEELNARYAEAKAAGINLINATFEYTTDGALERCLEAARVNGQKVMVGMPHENEDTCIEIVRSTKDHPAVIGYTMKDEPTPEHFQQLGGLRDKLRAEAREDQFVMCNLLPNYFTSWDEAPNPETGMTTYQKYLKDYMDIVRPDCLSLDHYPLATDPAADPGLLKCFLKNMTDIRNYGDQYGVETWGFIQSSGWNGRREPNLNELRFLINMHLAFGIKELTYFLYWQPWEIGKACDGYDYTGMITYQGEKTPVYDRAVCIDKEWKAMGTAYLDYDCEAFILNNIEDMVAEGMANAKVAESFANVAAIQSEGKMFTGCFDNARGGEGCFIVNFDYKSESVSSARIKLKASKSVKVWGKGGVEQELQGDAVCIEMGPGEAKFIEIS